MYRVVFWCAHLFMVSGFSSPRNVNTDSDSIPQKKIAGVCNDADKLMVRSPGLGYKFSHEANAWLRLHTTPASWADADRQCRLEGGSLAVPTTRALSKAMITMMTVENLTEGVFTAVSGTLRSNDSVKSDLRNVEYCVVLTIAGLMDYVPCTNERPYFCMKSPNQCAQGYTWSSRTTHCYKVHIVPQTWHNAAMSCRDENAYLAIINSDHEYEVLRDLFESQRANVIGNNAVAMIGFWKWDKDGEWMTVHGETLAEAGFDKWEEGQPDNAGGNEFCGSIIHKTGLLNDLPCNQPFAYICEFDPNDNINP